MDRKQQIIDSATTLFLCYGIDQTSVREITDHAHVAKGTFYLYFKDKQSLCHELLRRQLCTLLDEALKQVPQNLTFEQTIACFFDKLIGRCATHPEILKFIQSQLDYQGIKEHLTIYSMNNEVLLHQPFINYLVSSGYERQDALIRMVLALHFTLSTCYGAIILKQPAPLEVLKPYILSTVSYLLNRSDER